MPIQIDDPMSTSAQYNGLSTEDPVDGGSFGDNGFHLPFNPEAAGPTWSIAIQSWQYLRQRYLTELSTLLTPEMTLVVILVLLHSLVLKASPSLRSTALMILTTISQWK